MPIFPIMSSIAHPELARYTGITHCLIELYITIKQEIIISTIYKPATLRKSALRFSSASVTYFTQLFSITLRVSIAILEFGSSADTAPCSGIHQSTHRIDCTKHITMALAIISSSATSHRQAGNGTMQPIAYHPVFFLYIGQEFRIKECLIFPTGISKYPFHSICILPPAFRVTIIISHASPLATRRSITSFTCPRSAQTGLVSHIPCKRYRTGYFFFILFKTLWQKNGISTL